MHPLHTSGYKSLLVSTELPRNYEGDVHACVFECAEREKGRAAVNLVEQLQKIY